MIPIEELCIKTIKNFFSREFPIINIEKDLDIHYNISTQSSPGKLEESKGTRKYWFEPRGVNDLIELKQLNSNDTTLGCGYAPLSITEKTVLELEDYLNSFSYKKDKKWLGSDIKIMGVRTFKNIDLTLCIPQISTYVKSINDYKLNINLLKEDILKFLESRLSDYSINLNINTRDNYELNELYLTAIGSSIESGDEGLVGRGNRINGLISSLRPYSIEGLNGKNPFYHSGKLYNIIAQNIANKLYKKMNVYNQVFLISQSGRLLKDPWKILIMIDNKNINKVKIEQIVIQELNNVNTITEKLLEGEISLC